MTPADNRIANDLISIHMPKKKKPPSPKPVPQTSKMARSQNIPSKQQRDYNERVDFTQPNSVRKTPIKLEKLVIGSFKERRG